MTSMTSMTSSALRPKAKSKQFIVAAVSVFPKSHETKFFLSSDSPCPPRRARRVRILLKEAKSRKPMVIFHRAKCKVGHSWFRSSRRERRKGPYAVAVVVIATLKCAGGKKKRKGCSKVREKEACRSEMLKQGMSWCVVVIE